MTKRQSATKQLIIQTCSEQQMKGLTEMLMNACTPFRLLGSAAAEVWLQSESLTHVSIVCPCVGILLRRLYQIDGLEIWVRPHVAPSRTRPRSWKRIERNTFRSVEECHIAHGGTEARP